MLTLAQTFNQAYQDFNAGDWPDLEQLLDEKVVACAINHATIAEGISAVITYLQGSGGNFNPKDIPNNPDFTDNGITGTATGLACWNDAEHPTRTDIIHFVFGFVNRGLGWRILTLSATTH